MKKQKALKVVNPLLGLAFAAVALTGIFHEAIPWETYHRLHPAAGFSLVALAVAHVALNWPWISANYFRRKSRG